MKLLVLFSAFLLSAPGKPRLIAWRKMRRACLQKVKETQ